MQRRHGDEHQVLDVELVREIRVGHDDVVVHVLGVTHCVHLVDGDENVRDAEQRRDETVPPGLREHAFPSVDQYDRELRGRRARHHVARVLHVSRRVRDDEFALGCREVPVRDVDRDVLLPFGPQTVGEQSEIQVRLTAALAGEIDGLELVLEDGLGVIEQAADERALSVVDAARRAQAQQVHGGKFDGHQK